MNIKIGKGAHACSGCERSFEHEEELFSLVRLQDHLLQREDFCTQCWVPDHAAGAYSTWSMRFYDPKVAEQEPPEVFSPLRQTFYEAVESEERSTLAIAYLAAQLLRRQKVFRLIKESDEPDSETKISLFNDRIGNRLIEVRDPDLTHGELEDGRRLLMLRLNQLEAPDVDEEGAEETGFEIADVDDAGSQEQPLEA